MEEKYACLGRTQHYILNYTAKRVVECEYNLHNGLCNNGGICTAFDGEKEYKLKNLEAINHNNP